ncbi:MAG: hypothetical protein JWO62_2089 [Acidimicrobiaceae bacterium]|nr:hypothetical protein [Acidimicrobiaceae bacterium]
MAGSSSARVLLVYAALGLVAAFPIWPGDPSRIAACTCGGNKDPIQTAWFLAWTPYALLHGHNVFETTWINFPFGANLAQNTGVPLLGLLTSPLTLAVSPVASENLLRWLAFPLSAFAMYAVLLRWVRYAPAAFAGGLLYGFSPYMVGQASVHLDLSFVPLPPLILYALYEIVVRQEKSAARWGLILGALGTAQFYISAEVLATTALTAAIASLLLVVLRLRSVPGRLPHAVAGLSIAAAIGAASCSYPIYLMTHGPQRYVGPSMGLNEVYNADLLGSILPTSSQLVAPDRLVAIGSSLVGGLSNVDENGSYLGIPLLVIVAGLVLRYRRRTWILFALVMALVMSVLSLGPRLVVDGRYHRLPFALPFTAIRRLPLLENLLPARLALYVVLFVSILLAIGIAARHEDLAVRRLARASATERAAPGRRALTTAARPVVGAVVLASLVALLPRWPYRSVSVIPQREERPAALRIVPAGSAVLTYPYVTPSTDVAMLWQAVDGMRFKLFGSYVLRREPTGGPTQLPSGLQPYDVEGMLADPLAQAAVPIPNVPYLAPTTETVVAASIVIGPHHTTTGSGPPAVSGVVQNANPRTRSFYVVGTHGQLIGVVARRVTHYLPRPRSARPFRAVRRGEHVTVYGTPQSGTVDRRHVADLRRFLRIHHVDAVLVELGRHDSSEVVAWMTDAIGPPTKSGGGGAIWVAVQRDLGS